MLLPSCRGCPPAILLLGAKYLNELSIFVDESGGQGGHSRYCLVALVFHLQSLGVDDAIAEYEADLARRNLDNVVSHMSPLMNGHDAYANYDMATRKMMLATFEGFVRGLPFSYKAFTYRRSEVDSPEEFSIRFRKDLMLFLIDNLAFFQKFEAVKIYYDNGQPMVAEALHKAIDYAISKQAVLYRMATQTDYRLAQVADYICTLELTDMKFKAKELTATDIKIFGEDYQAFKRNHLKHLRKKMI